MSVLDVYSIGPTQINNDIYLDLVPDGTTGIELTIHNIYSSGNFELHFTNGTNTIIIDSFTDITSLSGLFLECTEKAWYRIKNISGTAQYVGATGRYTK
jgi:hypothetical protein